MASSAAENYDAVVIGGGSGGVAMSRRAAALGGRVALCEEGQVGGTCVLRGCVPKKLLVYGSMFREEMEDARGFGWEIEGARVDLARLIARKDGELLRLTAVYERLLRDAGVTLFSGRARLLGGGRVKVGEHVLSARHVVIATGGWPARPALRGIEHTITSNEALDLVHLPRRLLIMGGGYVAVEFASIFAGLGSEVTLVLRGDTILRGFDADVRAHLAGEMARRGIAIRAESRVTSIEREEGGVLSVSLGHGEIVRADQVLCATGRVPNTGDLGLAEAGVALGARGEVLVDEWGASSVPGVHAIGDCTHRLNLTPVAIAQGRALAETLFGGRRQPLSLENVPTAVFSQPPLGAVGLTEEQARARAHEVDVYLERFRPLKHTLSGREDRTLLKLVVDRPSDRLLGCHMVGEDAPEIIQGMAIALACGATKAQLDSTIGIHPTAAEELFTMRGKRPDHPAAPPPLSTMRAGPGPEPA